MSDSDVQLAESATVDPWRPPGTSLVATLAMVWLAIDLGIAYKTIDLKRGALAGAQVALFLPSIAAAALVAGAAIGLLSSAFFAGRFGGIERVRGRLLAGLLGGLVIGLISGFGMLTSYHGGTSSVAVAITVGVVATLGGGLSAVRPTAAVAGGLAGTIAYAAVTFVEAYFRNDLLNLFGAGNTVGSYATADSRLSLVVSIVTGIVGGAVSFLFLRRTALALPWPGYLAAGALPGIVLLFAQFATWVGGAPLMHELGKVSEFDKIAITTLQPGQVNSEMIVFFAGAVTAVILVGRTMRSSSSAQTS